jgi:hypothetical protein
LSRPLALAKQPYLNRDLTMSYMSVILLVDMNAI